MRIAVASDGLEVSKLAGACSSYTCYTVDRGVVTSCQNTPNPCLSAELTADYLQKLGVDVLISQNIEPELKKKLKRRGIEVVTDAKGPAKKAAEDFLVRFFSGDDGSSRDEDSRTATFA